MLRQFSRRRLDALDRTAFEIPCSEFSFHLLADVLPTDRADLRVYTAVGDDLDVAVGQQQIDQNAIVMRGVPDPQLREDIQGPLPRWLIAEQRRAVERTFDHEADLAGMGGLTLFDR